MAPSLTRGRVCILQFTWHCSQSGRTRNYISLCHSKGVEPLGPVSVVDYFGRTQQSSCLPGGVVLLCVPWTTRRCTKSTHPVTLSVLAIRRTETRAMTGDIFTFCCDMSQVENNGLHSLCGAQPGEGLCPQQWHTLRGRCLQLSAARNSVNIGSTG
jgi:hypothetical protein